MTVPAVARASRAAEVLPVDGAQSVRAMFANSVQ